MEIPRTLPLTVPSPVLLNISAQSSFEKSFIDFPDFIIFRISRPKVTPPSITAEIAPAFSPSCNVGLLCA